MRTEKDIQTCVWRRTFNQEHDQRYMRVKSIASAILIYISVIAETFTIKDASVQVDTFHLAASCVVPIDALFGRRRFRDYDEIC